MEKKGGGWGGGKAQGNPGRRGVRQRGRAVGEEEEEGVEWEADAAWPQRHRQDYTDTDTDTDTRHIQNARAEKHLFDKGGEFFKGGSVELIGAGPRVSLEHGALRDSPRDGGAGRFRAAEIRSARVWFGDGNGGIIVSRADPVLPFALVDEQGRFLLDQLPQRALLVTKRLVLFWNRGRRRRPKPHHVLVLPPHGLFRAAERGRASPFVEVRLGLVGARPRLPGLRPVLLALPSRQEAHVGRCRQEARPALVPAPGDVIRPGPRRRELGGPDRPSRVAVRRARKRRIGVPNLLRRPRACTCELLVWPSILHRTAAGSRGGACPQRARGASARGGQGRAAGERQERGARKRTWLKYVPYEPGPTVAGVEARPFARVSRSARLVKAIAHRRGQLPPAPGGQRGTRPGTRARRPGQQARRAQCTQCARTGSTAPRPQTLPAPRATAADPHTSAS